MITIQNDSWQNTINSILPSSIDLVVTDPPYNVNFKYNAYKDNLSFDDYLCEQKELINICFEKLKDGGSMFYLNYPETASLLWSEIYFKYKHINPYEMISWVYHPHTSGNPLRKAHRTWIWMIKGDCPKKQEFYGEYRNPTDKRILKRIDNGSKPKGMDWWEFEQVKNVSLEKTEHPCQIPEKMVEKIILGTTNEEDTVFDPFTGSGTVPVVCQKLNRNFIGSEIDSKYCEIIENRLRKEELNLFC